MHDAADDQLSKWYGWVELTPQDDVIAGSVGTWRLAYHVGEYGFDDGGTIKVAWRWMSDWASPQMADPAAPNYLSVVSTATTELRTRYDQKGHVRPWKRAIVIDVLSDPVAPGETITITYGDCSGGSAGTYAQTFCEDTFEFKTLVDPFGTGVFTELCSPVLRVVNGTPARLVVVAPSRVELEKPFAITVKAEDEWGNPCRDYAASLRVMVEGRIVSSMATEQAPGTYRVSGLQLSRPGPGTVDVSDGAGLAATSNPIIGGDWGGRRRQFWGDLHGQSEETVGTNSVEDYFRFARDYAKLDFVGHQANDFQITDEFWKRLTTTVDEFHRPSEFVAFLGYEWSGTTPAGGDRNVHFLGGGTLHRTSHQLVADKSDEATDRYPLEELYATLRAANEGERNVLLVPHVGGRRCDITKHDPELEPVVEVYSAWGEFEWLLRDAIERGYLVGFVAGSDDHKGRPGASYPGAGSFGVYGGLTCVYADALTREAIWEAIWARRCYATSGSRLLLSFRAGDHDMGALVETQSPITFDIEVVGTADIERIDLFRRTDCVFTFPDPLPRSDDVVRVTWSGARIRNRDRMARWDGTLNVRGGRIVEAKGYAFDSPAEGITATSPSQIAWRSVTTGDADGVVLRLEGDDSLELDLQTELLETTLTLGEIRRGPVRFALGGVDLELVFELQPTAVCGRHVRTSYTDDALPSERTAYWVRVTQTDGAKAWSSPIYIQPAPATAREHDD